MTSNINKYPLLQLVVLILVALLPCCGTDRENGESIGVVVTLPPIAQFVERIGGENVEVTVMVPPGASPHTYEPKPSQLVEVSKAKMYVKVGSGIEFELAWLDKIVSVNESMLVIDCSQGIDSERRDSSHQEEENQAIDPHIWVSPKNAVIMVNTIYEGLVSLDPRNKDLYNSNRYLYTRELEELDRLIENTFSTITNRKFIVYHPAWGCFADHYNLDQLPIEKEGKEPTAKGIARLVEQARLNNIQVIFASPQFSTETAEVIAKEISGSVILVDPLEKEYIKNLERVLKAFVKAME